MRERGLLLRAGRWRREAQLQNPEGRNLVNRRARRPARPHAQGHHARRITPRAKFSKDADALLKLLAEQQVSGIVIGLPINMDGSQGPRAQATRAFVRNMEPLTELPFAFWDERLSTVAAERALIGMDVSRARRAERIDAAAAAFILQGALDRLSSL
jgi:putative holliday junction resolvase